VCWDLNCLSHLAEGTGDIKNVHSVCHNTPQLKPYKTEEKVVAGT